jgi:phage/plasmid-associated DNA primase
MELIENLSLKKIQFLNQMNFKEFKQYCGNSAKNDDERTKMFDVLRGFCKSNIKARGQITRLYGFTEKNNVEVGGRLYCGNSLQSLKKQFRGFLCDGVMTDIDMKNAHPVIARYLCKIHGIDTPCLSYYIDNRDDILKQFGTDGKEKFLKALNNDQINKKETNKFLRDFDKECKHIQKEITAIDDYEHITKSVPESRTHNWLGSAFNRIMCVFENKILHSLISALNRRQIEIAALCFDGLLMYGNHYENKQLLAEIETEINSDWDGLGMRWSYKEHNKDIQMPDEWEPQAEAEVTGVWDDAGAMDMVLKNYPHWVFCRGDLYVYDKTTGMWDTSETAHYRVIMSLNDKLFVLTTDKDGRTMRTKNSYGNSEFLMKKLPKLIKTKCENNNWIDIQQYSSLGKILFSNGYYDFKQSKFYDVDEKGHFNTPEILFMGKINREFKAFDADGMDYIDSIKKRFFHDTLGVEMGNYLALNIARALAGDKMKRIVFGLGETQCGKSVLTTAVKLSCGDYVGSFNAENLAFRNSSSDEAANMRWAMLLRFKRLVFSNEIKNDVSLNGNAIKKISSGGDAIVGRAHGGNETEFILHFLAVVMANDLPKISPYDSAVANRCSVFSYKKQFVENPSNEFELKSDPYIQDEILTERFQNAFIGLLIREYLNFSDNGFVEVVPDEAIVSKGEWINEDSSFIERFKNDFEITNDEVDTVQSSEIEQWLQAKKTGITMTKFGVDLKKYCKINSLDSVGNKYKKISGKTKMVWFGIREIRGCETQPE